MVIQLGVVENIPAEGGPDMAWIDTYQIVEISKLSMEAKRTYIASILPR